MKWIAFAVLAISLVGCGAQAPHSGHGGHDGHSHGGGRTRLVVRTDPAEPEAGKPVVLRLTLRSPDGATVKDFEVAHEQEAHLVIVRGGLDTFAHLHPQVDADGTLTATYTFPSGGNYRLFVDHTPKGGKAATAEADLRVGGPATPAPALKPDVPGRVTGDGLSADVAVENAKAGGEATVRFALFDADGKPATDIQTYLGARGHLNVLGEDGTRYVHAHPDEGKPPADNVVTFGTHFPAAGVYKGWGQFRRGGEVRVVPFVVRVE